ncbi:hypothetical protein SBF1_50105 [Candidatus Desulfosporosinus infrequens]|uniref:Uncharacterized protein n=1 Tax=Candidatus Desulfosporosinus infrequens TaxID=2043169 RepID=A0A2U3LGY1_9FIRM|nr:hypothetical protein SBF1_50105 [Candidatus Desulfosporosinus infrequens]
MANEVVKEYYKWDETGEAFGISISYDAGDDCGPVAGLKLSGGQPKEVNGQNVVWFEKTTKGQPVAIKYNSRPDLAALVNEYKKFQAEQQTRHNTRAAAHQAEREAIDNPLLEDMEAEAVELRKKIPTGHIEVDVEDNGNLDGYPNLKYSVNGVELPWDKVNHIGTASAIRPGALGSFAQIYVVSIAKDQIEQIKKEQEEKSAINQAKKEAYQRELTGTIIPPAALEAYNYYHGDAELAWEKEDESSWALIERWTTYIEAQHGIAPRKLQHMVSESAREENYGINEG